MFTYKEEEEQEQEHLSPLGHWAQQPSAGQNGSTQEGGGQSITAQCTRKSSVQKHISHPCCFSSPGCSQSKTLLSYALLHRGAVGGVGEARKPGVGRSSQRAVWCSSEGGPPSSSLCGGHRHSWFPTTLSSVAGMTSPVGSRQLLPAEKV